MPQPGESLREVNGVTDSLESLLMVKKVQVTCHDRNDQSRVISKLKSKKARRFRCILYGKILPQPLQMNLGYFHWFIGYGCLFENIVQLHERVRHE